MRYLVTLWVREDGGDRAAVPVMQSVEAGRLPSEAEALARAVVVDAGFVVEPVVGIVVPLPDVDAAPLWQASREFGPF